MVLVWRTLRGKKKVQKEQFCVTTVRTGRNGKSRILGATLVPHILKAISPTSSSSAAPSSSSPEVKEREKEEITSSCVRAHYIRSSFRSVHSTHDSKEFFDPELCHRLIYVSHETQGEKEKNIIKRTIKNE